MAVIPIQLYHSSKCVIDFFVSQINSISASMVICYKIIHTHPHVFYNTAQYPLCLP